MTSSRLRLLPTACCALLVSGLTAGCQPTSDPDRQFNAAERRISTALRKVDPGLQPQALETLADSTVQSTSTPQAQARLLSVEPAEEGWTLLVEVDVEADEGVFRPNTNETRCYAFEVDGTANAQVPVGSSVVDCPE